MVKKLKRAFTITELVIVIAVIAILAAVLIPTFTSLINKANQSSDQSAVRNMNLALQNAEVDGELETLSEALTILEEAGMNAKNYSTLVKNTAFVWVRSINRVFYIDVETYEVLYPEEYKGDKYAYSGKEAWPTLEGAIRGNDDWLETEIEGKDLTDKNSPNTYGVVKDEEKITAIKVDRADRLVSVSEYLDKQNENENKEAIDLYLGGNIDLEGAEWNSIDHLYGNFNGNGYKISNLRMTDTTAYSEEIIGASGNGYTFYAFVSIFEGQTFTDVEINISSNRPGIAGGFVGTNSDNKVELGNHVSAGAIGAIHRTGKVGVTVSDVVVTGDIVGYNRCSGVIGFIGGAQNGKMSGSVTIQNCKNKASVTSTVFSAPGYAAAGGILGNTNLLEDGFVLNITGCENYGTIKASHAGGIMGRGYGDGNINFTSCKNYGEIYGIVNDKVNAASATAHDHQIGAGGIAADFIEAAIQCTISDCVNVGKISFVDERTLDKSNIQVWLGQIYVQVNGAKGEITSSNNADTEAGKTGTLEVLSGTPYQVYLRADDGDLT